MKYRIFHFWDAQNPEKKNPVDRLEKWLVLVKEYGPYGPQGPWAHKTKMFLLSSCYVVIIILIMMIQGQGQGLRPGPKKAPGVLNIFVLWAHGPWGP